MQTNISDKKAITNPKVDQLQLLINDMARYYSICDHYCTEQLKITASQGYTLLVMPETGSITMNELSLKMKLATSTMTRMADQLIQKGMIGRFNDVEDRRVVRVNLTQKGREVKTNLRGIMQDIYSQVLGGLPEDKQGNVLDSLEMLNKSILGVIQSCCGPDLIA